MNYKELELNNGEKMTPDIANELTKKLKEVMKSSPVLFEEIVRSANSNEKDHISVHGDDLYNVFGLATVDGTHPDYLEKDTYPVTLQKNTINIIQSSIRNNEGNREFINPFKEEATQQISTIFQKKLAEVEE
jgi:hypothetical protein